MVNGIGGTFPEATAIKAGGRRNHPVTHKNKVNMIEILPKLLCHLNKYFSSKAGLFFLIWGTNQNKMPVKVKTIKIPVSPITLSSKGWNLREQWADFETAIDGLQNSGCDGLSFILTKDDPFLCIDLDNVSEDKKALVDDFSETYIEISQSGKGLHIFAKGEIADNFNNQIEKVEMYQNNRCIAMTGNSIDGISNNIIDNQSEIDRYSMSVLRLKRALESK